MAACVPVAFYTGPRMCLIAYVHMCLIESSVRPGERSVMLFGLGIQLSCQNSRRKSHPTGDAEMKAEREEQAGFVAAQR